MARLSEYKPEHAETLLRCLSEGMLDCEIYAELDICKNTFIRWRKEYDDFNQAYELGLPKCEAWWIREMKKKWQAGDDKGFKYCAIIVNTKFGYRDNQSQGGTVNNTQINVQGNMNVLDSKSTAELANLVSSNFEYLTDNNIINVKAIDDRRDDPEQI